MEVPLFPNEQQLRGLGGTSEKVRCSQDHPDGTPDRTQLRPPHRFLGF